MTGVTRPGSGPALAVGSLDPLGGGSGPCEMLNTIREYDWGSTRALAALQGREPSGRPEAELWIGAHPVTPSWLRLPAGGEVSLAAAIEADPVAVLGKDCLERFGARLPFLLKILAVDRALSIQVHPGRSQAADGFAREQDARVPSAMRSYVDPYAKPEMLLPVTEFATLAGLRDRERVIQMLASLDIPALAHVLEALRSRDGQSGSAGTLAALATWPRDRRAALASAVAGRARELLDGPGAQLDADEQSSLGWVIMLARQHPGDPLVMAPLILRLHLLQPGRPMYLPPGVPHAHLTGTGLEIMASSDNVVRAGLTSKQVDGHALVQLLDPGAQPLLEVPRESPGEHETRWRPPVPDFALSRVVVAGEPVTLCRDPRGPDGPEMLLCVAGEVTVSAGGRSLSLRGGRSAFLGVRATPAVLVGIGEVYRATAGL